METGGRKSGGEKNAWGESSGRENAWEKNTWGGTGGEESGLKGTGEEKICEGSGNGKEEN